MPNLKKPIEEEAQRVTKIVVHDSGPNRYMTSHNQRVSHVDLKTCISDFLQWLSSNGYAGNCLLVAHNGRKFDFNVLLHALIAVDMVNEFNEAVLGFCNYQNFEIKNSWKEQRIS